MRVQDSPADKKNTIQYINASYKTTRVEYSQIKKRWEKNNLLN